jgi:cyclohexanecarboxylate-CoA ligase
VGYDREHDHHHDVARVRPDGGIRIAGRTKDLVIRGGENVPVLARPALLVEITVIVAQP